MTARGGPWVGAPPEQIANRYYDAATWIYRRAWGRSFHFAPLRRHESRVVSIRRYEHEVAAAVGLRATSVGLDLGCGVGGPATTIAAATQAGIVALNANLGQLGVLGRAVLDRPDVAVRPVAGEFGRLPFAARAFDAAYAFEALCHAVDLASALGEVARVLRAGGTLGFSEWCLTEAFDPDDATHRALRRQIETSYGVAQLRTWPEWHAALLGAGFAIERSTDRAALEDGDGEAEPWYRALLPRDGTLDSLGRSGVVRALEAAALALAERVRLAPHGTAATVHLLRRGTAALVDAGRRGIFTPMRFVLATKPADR